MFIHVRTPCKRQYLGAGAEKSRTYLARKLCALLERVCAEKREREQRRQQERLQKSRHDRGAKREKSEQKNAPGCKSKRRKRISSAAKVGEVVRLRITDCSDESDGWGEFGETTAVSGVRHKRKDQAQPRSVTLMATILRGDMSCDNSGGSLGLQLASECS